MNCSPYVMRRRRAIAEVMAIEIEALIGPKPPLMFDQEGPIERCKNDGCPLPLVTAQERAYSECWPCQKERAGNG